MTQPPLEMPIFDNIVTAVFKNNRRRRSFVPSEDNVIGGMTFGKVMLDSGCSTILLPILNGQETLQEMKTLFPVESHRWSIVSGSRVGSINIVLCIKKLHPDEQFEVHLCRNLGGQVMRVSFLRFFLCGEDIEYLSRTRNKSLPGGFPWNDADRAMLHLHRSNPSSRRLHALIGQSILSRHRSYNDLIYTYIFAYTRILTPCVLHNISTNATILALQATDVHTQPQDFEDLEDEDHLDGEVDHGDSKDEQSEPGGDTGDEE